MQRAVIRARLAILHSRFVYDDKTEGCCTDAPVNAAKFEQGEGGEPQQRKARVLR
jgi:hypothetical protein